MSFTLTQHVSRAPFIFLRHFSVAVSLSSCRLFLSRTSDLPTFRSFSSKYLPSDVYSFSSFFWYAALRPSLYSIRPYVVLRSSFYDNIVLYFSPTRRGCNRASLSRARLYESDWYLPALSFPWRDIAPSSLHSRVPASSDATKKNTRCIFVAFIDQGIALLVALTT